MSVYSDSQTQNEKKESEADNQEAGAAGDVRTEARAQETYIEIKKIDTETSNQLFIQDIKQASVYPSVNNIFGFNSKFVLGNNANYNIVLEGNDLDIRKRFVNEISLEASNITDADVTFLKINSNGSIFTLVKRSSMQQQES